MVQTSAWVARPIPLLCVLVWRMEAIAIVAVSQAACLQAVASDQVLTDATCWDDTDVVHKVSINTQILSLADSALGGFWLGCCYLPWALYILAAASRLP